MLRLRRRRRRDHASCSASRTRRSSTRAHRSPQRPESSSSPKTPRAARARSESEAIYDANRHRRAATSHECSRPNAGAPRRARTATARGLCAATIERFASATRPTRGTAWSTSCRATASISALAAERRPGQERAARLLRFLSRPADDSDVRDDGRGDRVRRPAIGDGEPKYLNTTTTPVYTKGRHLFALNVARRAAQHDRTIIVRRRLSRLHRAAPGRLRERGRLARHVVHRRAGAPNFASTPRTSSFASTATPPGARLQPKPSTWRLTGSNTLVPRCASSLLPPGEDPGLASCAARGADGVPRAPRTQPSPRSQFKIDAEIDAAARRLRFTRARSRAKAEALIRRLAPREEWDRWRVYVAGQLQVSADDLRNSRFLA